MRRGREDERWRTGGKEERRGGRRNEKMGK